MPKKNLIKAVKEESKQGKKAKEESVLWGVRVCRWEGKKVFDMQRCVKYLAKQHSGGSKQSKDGEGFGVFTYLCGTGTHGIWGRDETFRSFSLKKNRQRTPFFSLPVPNGMLWGRQIFLRGAQWWDKRQWTQVRYERVLLGIMKTFSPQGLSSVVTSCQKRFQSLFLEIFKT